MADEYRHGRSPLWNPYSYAGTPLATVPKYSPFYLVYCLFPAPVTLAYIVLLEALVAAGGAYLFFRGVLRVGFWPAAVGAWCYPLTGFFVLWQGFPLPATVAWLPWLLLATDRAVRRPGGWAGLGLAACTALVLVSGQPDVAGQALLVSGLYFLWSLADAWAGHRRVADGARALLVAGAGWACGILLTAPYLLPLLEYSRTGSRLEARRAGAEERPPIGLKALPEVVLPFTNGNSRLGSVRLAGVNDLEGPASAYVGLLATLVAAPLAWASRRHCRLNGFWTALAFLGLAWQLDVPLLVPLLRLPLLNMMSHNRLVFATAFALLALAVTGLEVLRTGGPAWGRWCALPAGILAVIGLWCVYRALRLPEPFATQLATLIRAGKAPPGMTNLAALEVVKDAFRAAHLGGALLCVGGMAVWAVLARPNPPGTWFRALLAALPLGELLWAAWGVNPQADPARYFPPIPVITELRQHPSGRILGVSCLPPNLNLSYGWRDVRGYDATDPRPILDLLEICRQPGDPSPGYARTQYYVPRLRIAESGQVVLPPVLSMLNVRYLVLGGSPPPGARALLQHDPFWVLENADAVPRAFVPRRVVAVPPGAPTLKQLAADDFDPRRVAYVEEQADLPDECEGRAEVVEEVPTRLAVSAEMRTAGLLVVADQWSEGWQAYRDGLPVPVVRTNHALRGVALPAGHSTIEFRYEPASLTSGLRLFVGGVAVLGVWAAVLAWSRRRSRKVVSV
jgi:hypothetical protein